jgi:hypothetical protein
MKVLAAHEREKKRKCLEPCLEQRRHFSPFVISTDSLIGKEAQTMLKKLSARLAEKLGKPYSLLGMRVHQCLHEHCHCPNDSSLLARLQSPYQSGEQSSAGLGGWRKLGPIPSLVEPHVRQLVTSMVPSKATLLTTIRLQIATH